MIQRCDDSLQLEVEFVRFSHSLRVKDSHPSQADRCLCVSVNDLGSLWDTKTRTRHVARRGQQ